MCKPCVELAHMNLIYIDMILSLYHFCIPSQKKYLTESTFRKTRMNNAMAFFGRNVSFGFVDRGSGAVDCGLPFNRNLSPKTRRWTAMDWQWWCVGL